MISLGRRLLELPIPLGAVLPQAADHLRDFCTFPDGRNQGAASSCPGSCEITQIKGWGQAPLWFIRLGNKPGLSSVRRDVKARMTSTSCEDEIVLRMSVVSVVLEEFYGD